MQNPTLPPIDPGVFRYGEAFSRNLGWVTDWEQQLLHDQKIAIAGLGGVGGAHLLTLARLGIGAFHIADLDTFEIANFNRQAGALVSTIGRPKLEVLARMAWDINPQLKLTQFPEGVHRDNLDTFLAGVDLFVDGLDFFELEMRRAVFARCAELGIPAITAAPIGMGAAYLMFLPGHMGFEEYFRFQGLPRERQYVNFLVGLDPKGFHRTYLVDPARLDLAAQRGPSTAMACQLCAGVTGTEALKILLKRGPLYPAPYYHQFDAYRCRWHVGFLPGGNRHPLQFLKRRMGYQSVARLSPPAALETFAAPLSEMEQILDLARWAPSGDNSQPWRFEILSPQRLVVHVRDQAAEDVYDYNQGQPTLLSCGLLLETMGIAASRHKYSLRWEYTRNQGNRHRIEVELRRDEQVVEDPLLPYIPLRSVNRRPFRTLPLNPAQKQWLERSAGPEFTLTWHESWQERLQIARLNALATDIRLRIPEAYRVHQKILDWDRHFSPDGVPARAIGLDPLTLKVMRWALRDWSRMQRLNRLPGATFGARLQMDYLPGLQCATHFSMARTQNPAPADQGPALLRAGQAWQRFWLTATRLGLALQPGMAPLIFAYHARHGIPFTSEVPLRRKAEELDTKLRKSWAGDPDHLLFRGRLGWPKSRQVTARSFRRPLAELLQPWDEPQTNKEG